MVRKLVGLAGNSRKRPAGPWVALLALEIVDSIGVPFLEVSRLRRVSEFARRAAMLLANKPPSVVLPASGARRSAKALQASRHGREEIGRVGRDFDVKAATTLGGVGGAGFELKHC
jgi:hypothetical protein